MISKEKIENIDGISANGEWHSADDEDEVKRLALLGLSMQWQPIETAPKSGVRFLAWCPEIEDAVICRLWVGGTYRTDEGNRFAPTHWMPLPEPPR